MVSSWFYIAEFAVQEEHCCSGTICSFSFCLRLARTAGQLHLKCKVGPTTSSQQTVRAWVALVLACLFIRRLKEFN